MTEIKPGKYQHYKGKYYEVIGMAHHSETMERMVVYRALYDHLQYGKNSLWVRPAKMFEEIVEAGEGKVPRFKKID